MKIVIMIKDGMVEKVYTDGEILLEAVELDFSSKEEAVRLPKKGWTDVSLCNVDLLVNRNFVNHVFDDEGREIELEKWRQKSKKN